MKNKLHSIHKNKRRLWFGLTPIILVGFLALSAVTTLSVLATTRSYKTELIIPEKFLKLSNDKKTLLGLKDDIRPKDISAYDCLKIPDTVETIDAFAFYYVFNDVNLGISRLILNNNLKTVKKFAFAHCYSIKNIDFSYESNDQEPQLESIEEQSFSYCGFQNNLDLPKSLKNIGERAFEGCSDIDGTVTFPSSLENVGSYAFNDCTGINVLNFKDCDDVPIWLRLPNHIFNNVGTAPSKHGRSILLNLHNDSLSLWTDCIRERQNLPSDANFVINVLNKLDPKNIKTNEDNEIIGFEDNFDVSTLKNYSIITLPQGATKIKEGAFNGKIKNCHVTISFNDITDIEDNAFKDCSGIYQDVTLNKVNNIGDDAFRNCTHIQKVEITNGFKKIGDSAFEGCSNLNELILSPPDDPEINQTFGLHAFKDCKNLTYIHMGMYNYFPDDWRDSASKDPFVGISPKGSIIVSSHLDIHQEEDKKKLIDLLTDLGIPNLNKSIDGVEDSGYWSLFHSHEQKNTPESSFVSYRSNSILNGFSEKGEQDKTDYLSICIPDSIQYIKHNAFTGEFPLRKEDDEYVYWRLKFNEQLLSIGDDAFKDNDGLGEDLEFGPELQYIGNDAFNGCSHLRGTLSFPDSITYIGNSAFKNCYFLTNSNLVLPAALDYVGSNAFEKTSINKITFSSGVTGVQPNAFYNIEDLSEIDLTKINYYNFSMFSENSLRVSQTTGTIYVNHTSDLESWKTVLAAKGLPSGWTVES